MIQQMIWWRIDFKTITAKTILLQINEFAVKHTLIQKDYLSNKEIDVYLGSIPGFIRAMPAYLYLL